MPGRYAVGFTTIEVRDPTRYDRPKVDRNGQPVAGDRARRFTVHLWYPAAAGSGRRMTFADYMFSHFADTVSETARQTDRANRRRFFARFGTVSDSAWNRLESAIFTDRVFWPLSRGWGYNVAAMRAPFLHTYSVPLSRDENRFADFEAMRNSNRHHFLVDAPGIDHWDFALEGMAASTILGVRGQNAPRLQKVFETTNRYVLAFFNAYVKGDAAELAFLRRQPEANGAPTGLATVRELRAVTQAER